MKGHQKTVIDETRWKRITDFVANISWTSFLFAAWFSVLAVIIIVTVTVRLLAPRLIQNVAETYTAETPLAIPHVELSEDILEATEKRIDAFMESEDEEQSSETLVLTEEELNGLIQRNDDEPLGYLKLGQGLITAQISILLEEDIPIGPWSAQVQGRYLNGEATLHIGIDQGKLNISLESFQVQGKPVPPWALRRVRDKLDLEKLMDDDEADKIMERVATLEVLPGRLILHRR